METIRVAAAIIYQDGKILACHRADADASSGWELPGGKIEPGERPEDALRREVLEELDAKLQLVWLYDTIEHDYPDLHLTMDCFVSTLAPGAVPEAREGIHDELRWLGQQELLDVPWLAADIKLMRSLGTYWDIAFEAEHL